MGMKPVISGATAEKAMALYRAGCDDGQIAEKIHVSRFLVKRWRNSNFLPSNSKRSGIPDIPGFMELYDAGFSDPAISEKLGISRYAAERFRKKHGLPGHRHIPAAMKLTDGELATTSTAAETKPTAADVDIVAAAAMYGLSYGQYDALRRTKEGLETLLKIGEQHRREQFFREQENWRWWESIYRPAWGRSGGKRE